MAPKQRESILILAKTYPSPSKKHSETVCVAGINSDGLIRRLFPIPFRLLAGENQFKKWQWVHAIISKSSEDSRPESYKLYVDTIECYNTIESRGGWAERIKWIEKIPTFHNFGDIEKRRRACGGSIALLRPKKLVALDIEKATHQDWSKEEKEKLEVGQIAGELFPTSEARKPLIKLKKVPFDFYYRYICDTPEGEIEHRHKISDWEVGALYWKCLSSYGDTWETPFRKKLEHEFAGKDLMLLMGNMHRFPRQWLIISLFYPPKQVGSDATQGKLL